VRVVESSLKCERYVFVEKDLRSRAERHPLVPVVLRIAISAPLVDENWHDGKLVVRLIKHLFCDEDPNLTLEEIRTAALSQRADPLDVFSFACRRELRDILQR